MFAGIAENIENGFNNRHILRRKILKEYTEKNNLLLVEAAKRSGSFMGWFVKDGSTTSQSSFSSTSTRTRLASWRGT
ncbi:MAG TPA: hypothetical protein VM050_11385 [Patescibacteria group bacterium]|nr:hypothetical protein [Patescibacteria group bacterium]